MVKDGRQLEEVVAEFERLLLGSGFQVTPNDRVFDDEGNQIAEFDIRIEGRVGSTWFNWLIECRDRPSQGPAPSSWIQHLAGRKQLFGFDKVIAVSTTGFSKPAKEAAAELGIAIREVSSTDEISGEFGTVDFRLQHLSLSMKTDVDFAFSEEDYGEARKLLQKISDPKIRYVGEDEFLTLWQFVFRHYSEDPRIREPDEPERRDLVFQCNEKMELSVGAQVFQLAAIAVPVLVEYSYHLAKALSVKSYGEDGAVIGEEVTLSADVPGGVVRSAALIVRKDGEVFIRQHAPNEFIPGS